MLRKRRIDCHVALQYIIEMVAIFFIVFGIAGGVFSFSGEMDNISGKKYYSAVKDVLDKAEKSIFMVMYLVSLDANEEESLVFKLCQSLVDAKKRGVIIKVILDQNIDYEKGKKDDKWLREDKNENAFEFFKKNNIEVLYDDVTSYTHAKAIVVDEKVVVAGSTNWSKLSLTRNNETSVLLKSPELVKSILKDFSEISIDFDAGKSREEREPVLAIYRFFFDHENLAGQMVSDQDERSFDLYLYLLREFKDNAVMDFDYDKYAAYLGIDKKMESIDYRRQLIKTLKKLDERYRLIEFTPEWGKNSRIKLLDPENRLKEYEYPKGRFFLLPGEYFKFGWDKKLLFREKYCYFINLYKASLSNESPWWFGAQDTLCLQFHIQKDVISQGMMELRRINLIDVEYSSTDEGYENREPTRYRLLNLYSPENLVEKIKRLEKLYNDEKVAEAIEFAKVVFKENDPVAIEDILRLIDEFGKKKVADAIEIVRLKAVDNPKRTFRYFVGIVRK